MSVKISIFSEGKQIPRPIFTVCTMENPEVANPCFGLLLSRSGSYNLPVDFKDTACSGFSRLLVFNGNSEGALFSTGKKGHSERLESLAR